MIKNFLKIFIKNNINSPNRLQNLDNIYFANMTGSGSTIIGYFLTKNAAIKAQKKLKNKYKNYWCIYAKTI